MRITIKPIAKDSIASFKTTRLRALQDTPLAFGSTYSHESQLSDADWKERVARYSSERAIGYLAWDDKQTCGIVGCFLDDNDPATAHIVSMWIAPRYRKIGIGRMLIETVIQWADAQKIKTLFLMVTSCNLDAIHFYERLGFTQTGRIEPYPNKMALAEYEMIKSL